MIRECEEKEDVLVFDSDLDERLSSYDAAHLDRLASAEKVHFWFKHRREYLCRLFQKYVSKEARILEIGSGTGFIAEGLSACGFEVEVSDIHTNGLLYAKKRGLSKLYQFDLYRPPFAEEFDVVCLFDVLEHLHDPHAALTHLKSMLKPGGLLILSVPAHDWLWSRDDVIAGHSQRYTKKSLGELFRQHDVKPIYMRYFFKAILPLLLLRTFLRKDRGFPLEKRERVDLDLHPIANRILDYLTRFERGLNGLLPNWAGGSLFAIAQKSGTSSELL